MFTYPVLMAADILIYDSDIVPVGVDQVQHIEVTRDIAERFNSIYGEVFVLPEARVLDSSAKVPGTDGEKMSKSYGNVIELFEPAKRVRKKVMSIKPIRPQWKMQRIRRIVRSLIFTGCLRIQRRCPNWLIDTAPVGWGTVTRNKPCSNCRKNILRRRKNDDRRWRVTRGTRGHSPSRRRTGAAESWRSSWAGSSGVRSCRLTVTSRTRRHRHFRYNIPPIGCSGTRVLQSMLREPVLRYTAKEH